MILTSFPHLIVSIIVISFGIFVCAKNKYSKVNHSFALFCLPISIWLFASFIAYNCRTEFRILLWFKISYMGIIFIPVTFYHFVFNVLNRKIDKIIVKINYIVGLIFSIVLSFNWLIIGLYKYQWGYYPKASPYTHPLFLLFFSTLFAVSAITLFLGFTSKKATRSLLGRMRIKYIFLGTLVGFLGIIDFLPNYGVPIYPFGFIFMVAYPIILAYAIVKVNVMNIRVAITRAGIFLAVYTCILGIPFWIGYATNYWLIPTFIVFLLAPVGPVIYSYLRRRVEDILFKEQRRYQEALRELGVGVIQIRKELDSLLKKIAVTLYQEIKPVFMGMYIFSERESIYVLKHKYSKKDYSFVNEISAESFIVKEIYSHKKPIFIELGEAFNLSSIPQEALVIPYFVRDRLFGFSALGPKQNRMVYSQEDIRVFETLSSQASIAIENCLFWQEEYINEQIRRQKAMDHFSASLAHEIQNPITAAVGSVVSLKEVIAEDWKGSISSDKAEYFEKKLTRAIENLVRISKMIKAVRELSRQTTGGFTLLKMDEVIENFLYIFEPQIKYHNIDFQKEVEPDLYLMGNKIHLEEVLMNLGNNAVHAVENKEPGKRIISLKVHKGSGDTFLIIFKDNGYGIKKELLEDIFLDFVTTKASSIGTGMGLARVRKIVENHGGKIWVESEGEGDGATFFVLLPLMKEKISGIGKGGKDHG